MATKTMTVREFYGHLERNGFKHLRGQWMNSDFEDDVIGGCVLAQGAINSGAVAYHDYYDSEDLMEARYQQGAFDTTVLDQLNRFVVPDDHKWSEVADMAREILEPFFDETITVEAMEYKIPIAMS